MRFFRYSHFNQFALVLGFLFVWCSRPVVAQTQESAQPALTPLIRFQHLGVANGLSSPVVYHGLQDSRGFLWFGTVGGLNRYDGIDFKVYLNDPNDPHTVSDNYIWRLYEDPQGVLWVATWGGGINQFDRASETFVRYQHEENDPTTLSSDFVWSMVQDRRGALWVSTDGGLDRFDPETGTFTAYQHDPNDPTSVSHNSVSQVLEDGAGRLWVATYGGGLNLFDPESETFARFQHDDSNPASLSSDAIAWMHLDRAGRFWLGTDNGLDQFDPETKRFVHHQHDESNPNSLSDNSIWYITEDQAGMLWVATNGGGVNQFDPARGTFVRHQQVGSKVDSLSNNQVWFGLQDQTGVFWFGTADGLNQYDPARQRFAIYQHDPANSNTLSENFVKAVYASDDGILWIGTAGGLNEIDRAHGKITRYRHDEADPISLRGDDVIALAPAGDGGLWVATVNSLQRFDPVRKTFTAYPAALTPNDNVTALAVDRTGIVWINSHGNGLVKFDPAHNVATRYQTDVNDANSLVSIWMTDILVDSAGLVWVATESGLSRLDPATATFTTYQNVPQDANSPSSNMINTIYEDRAGNIWLGTNNGLNKFEPPMQTFTRYSNQAGWVGNDIVAIVEDDQGFLWLSTTNNGLTKFDPANATFHSYDQQDGLPTNQMSYRAADRSPQGELFFGSANGLVSFSPAQLTDNPYIPPVVITDFKLFNQPVAIGANSPLRQQISVSDQLTLSYAQSVFSFEFAALNYRAASKNRYAYMMEGFDRDWTYVDSRRRFATYTNLDPGQYTFRVKAANNDGVWNETGAALALTITPPWWRTWWAYTLYGLAALGVVAGYVQYRTQAQARALVQKEHELEQERRLGEELEGRVQERTVQLATANEQITALNERLKAENMRLSAELEVTRHLQQMILPKTHELQEIEGLDIAGFMEPADEVGGDYYDILHHNGHVKIGIGDVTGHGLESGVLMLMTQMGVRTLLTNGEQDAKRFMTTLNRTLYDNAQRIGTPRTLTLSLLDYRAGCLTLSGHHEELIVVRQASDRDWAIERIDTFGLGFPIGMQGDIDDLVGQLTIELQPGDGVVLYTDGITEAINMDHVEYGLECLCAVVRQNWAAPAELIKQAIIADLRRHIGQQAVFDDITVVVLKQK
ncbi:MAG TPA: two-component regulator propeller domain-containing protein [Caldilineaceae bacterium]|nr:two-component regulator propeller domain-containing protein [Caldilineaceae bacterium]